MQGVEHAAFTGRELGRQVPRRSEVGDEPGEAGDEPLTVAPCDQVLAVGSGDAAGERGRGLVRWSWRGSRSTRTHRSGACSAPIVAPRPDSVACSGAAGGPCTAWAPRVTNHSRGGSGSSSNACVTARAPPRARSWSATTSSLPDRAGVSRPAQEDDLTRTGRVQQLADPAGGQLGRACDERARGAARLEVAGERGADAGRVGDDQPRARRCRRARRHRGWLPRQFVQRTVGRAFDRPRARRSRPPRRGSSAPAAARRCSATSDSSSA